MAGARARSERSGENGARCDAPARLRRGRGRRLRCALDVRGGGDARVLAAALGEREIARPTHPAKGGVRSRVVLLHGWLMSHACWLNTATQLRDRYGHDVLLLDFPRTGARLCSPSSRITTLWLSLRPPPRGACGFARGQAPARRLDGAAPSIDPIDPEQRFSSKATTQNPLVLCGLSLGGVVSCLYADAYPGEVSRVVLVASPGNTAKLVRAAEPLAPAPRLGAAPWLSLCARAAGASAGGWCPAGARPRTPRCRTLRPRVRDTPTPACRATCDGAPRARGRPHGAGVGRAGPVPHRADQALEGGQAARPRRAARAGTHRTHRRRSLRTRR